jgi:hypothetical protein
MEAIMAWIKMTFGKHEGYTLPEILFRDPDWYFCKSGEMERQQNGSLSGCCVNIKASRERLSLISSEVT